MHDSGCKAAVVDASVSSGRHLMIKFSKKILGRKGGKKKIESRFPRPPVVHDAIIRRRDAVVVSSSLASLCPSLSGSILTWSSSSSSSSSLAGG